jgi:16S rRNA (guanine527-N7)-methyltransferase
VARRHFLPSLLALDHATGRRRGADLGPGAGFPSVPVKILRPELDLTLIESVGKKARFLKDLRAALDLERCEIVNGRAEAYPGPAFDLLFLKAAGPIRDWVPCVSRLLAPAGRAVFFKTPGRVGPEIAAARPRLERAGFGWKVQERRTPLEGRPLALVVLERSGPAAGFPGDEGPLDGLR